MNTKPIDDRQKKFLLIVPLLAFPFLALFFWSLGGGKEAQAQSRNQLTGLNTQLPGAKLKNDSAENKLTLYQQAEQDSLKFKNAQKDDPYYRGDTTGNKAADKSAPGHYDASILPNENGAGSYQPFTGHGLTTTANSLSANEQMVNRKLAALKQQLNQPVTPLQPAGNTSSGDGSSGAALKRLQAVMQHMNNAGTADPQMEQLSSMLDKIQEIQYPGLVRQKMQLLSQKNQGKVYPVTTGARDNSLSTLDSPQMTDNGNISANGFFSFDRQAVQDDSQNTIEAVIHETQTLVNGATVKLRLVNDIYINGVMIPKNNFVYGIADLEGERLEIKVSSIRYRKSLFPVNLVVYDMDGLDGIHIPGAITRDVAKESADQSLQNIGLTSYDPSIGAQAAQAGITAAKTLFGRKVRLVKVTVKDGYQVLLKDEKQKSNN